MKKRIKINGVIIFICVIAMMLFPNVFLRMSFNKIDILTGILGLELMFFGLLLRVSSRGYKSELSVGGNNLVRTGPYSLVRNPMYLGICCIALGIIMVLFQWWTLAVFGIFFALRYLTLIRVEEKGLLEKFGHRYSEYQKDVPRILPRLNTRLNKDLLNCLPLKLSWIKKELNSILIIVPGVLGIDMWKKFILCENDLALPYFLILSWIICALIVLAAVLVKNYEGYPKQK
ncbi:MAG: isoprenylcysteine carboxylmethyltransferase family protein [Candidatus Omnitrophota bacterium]